MAVAIGCPFQLVAAVAGPFWRGVFTLRKVANTASLKRDRLRIWWNWQTRYFEVVVGQPVQVQVLLCAPIFQ
jgi:hypothetical protein